jgi:hypothetical protein
MVSVKKSPAAAWINMLQTILHENCRHRATLPR